MAARVPCAAVSAARAARSARAARKPARRSARRSTPGATAGSSLGVRRLVVGGGGTASSSAGAVSPAGASTPAGLAGGRQRLELLRGRLGLLRGRSGLLDHRGNGRRARLAQRAIEHWGGRCGSGRRHGLRHARRRGGLRTLASALAHLDGAAGRQRRGADHGGDLARAEASPRRPRAAEPLTAAAPPPTAAEPPEPRPTSLATARASGPALSAANERRTPRSATRYSRQPEQWRRCLRAWAEALTPRS